MGDSNFDKNGVGPLDEKKYASEKGLKWRYQQLGKEWWYWTPSGHWCYWRGGQWCNYDQNTYADIGGAQGPYYEDNTGFFHLAGGRKVYDPQIHRDAAGAGVAPAGAPAGTSTDAASSGTPPATSTGTSADSGTAGTATGTPADSASTGTGAATSTGTPADSGTTSTTAGTPADVPAGAPKPPPG